MGLKTALETIKNSLKDIKAKFFEAAQINDLEATEDTPLSEYVNVFKQVGNSGWKYPSDWIDVHKVMEEDTYDSEYYNYGRAVVLLKNDSETSTFTLTSYPYAAKTSDGAFYNRDTDGSTITHTWTPSNEKTRWVIFYYRNISQGRNKILDNRYLPTDALYVYMDIKGFCWDSENGLTASSHPYLQGLECTPETTTAFCGDSGQYYNNAPFHYVNLPINYGLSINVPYSLFNNAPNLKYLHFQNLPAVAAQNIKQNYVNFDDYDWSTYTGNDLLWDFSANYVEGVVDLSNYTSDSTVNIFYTYVCGDGDIKIKLPNAPVVISYEGFTRGSIAYKTSFWLYLAEHAPYVEGRKLTIGDYYLYSYFYNIKATIDGMTPYELLIHKGWTIYNASAKF